MADQDESLAELCLPRLGQRETQLVLAGRGGSSDRYEIDWPYAHVPLAVLRPTGEAESMARELEVQLLTDELTGAANRRGFDRALHAAARHGAEFAVFYIDMNGFKLVNDTYGHDAGDELLTVVAKRLSNEVRPCDTVSRLGGDEFAIVLAGGNCRELAERLPARLKSSLGRELRLSAVDAIVHPGAAVGYAMPQAPGENLALVLRRADQAMYADKAMSREATARAA